MMIEKSKSAFKIDLKLVFGIILVQILTIKTVVRVDCFPKTSQHGWKIMYGSKKIYDLSIHKLARTEDELTHSSRLKKSLAANSFASKLNSWPMKLKFGEITFRRLFTYS